MSSVLAAWHLTTEQNVGPDNDERENANISVVLRDVHLARNFLKTRF